MFSHVYLGSDDLAASKRFYDAAMGALGYQSVELPHAILYPSESSALLIGKPLDGGAASHGNGHTLGFVAKDYAAVDRFHADGLAAGGTSEGAPGFRATSPGNQYGAYLRDPFGNKICTFAPNVGEKQ